MVLKKQTVWLITMLSLLIVLSVYYMTAPDNVAVMGNDDEEQTEEDNKEGTDEGTEDGTEGETGSNVDVSGMNVDEVFATIRMERDDTRGEQIESWNNVVASENATAEEKSEARDKIHELQTIAQKETILEETIQYEKEYRDVLVRNNEEVVQITVIANELSKTDANELMQMARDEFGQKEVRVKLQEDDV
ncbi:SpoIIIAH-like family protein [Tenuibacillus multivorans]|uniref:Stage III sporulation protein AH n=1 Tax=Tenuibacillus multivorans TaxID=237069 RepID=A0A1G9Z8W2_9BACI|nr:SpoIIIAH-like family protein [Tenuibacillus multivorans]GEL77367.1 stage III sporulation protein AH [Tenuibacillus multivorans]SDN17261.1 stage III sporulation protein AH [Tenuibacillus multivorans]